MTDPGDPLAWRASWLSAIARTGGYRLVLPGLLLLAAVPLTIALLAPWLAAVLLVALLVSLDEVLLPVSYRVDDDGAVARTALRTRRHPWADFTEARPTPYGVLLRSPIRRSLHLLCGDRTEAVLAHAVARVTKARARPMEVKRARGLESNGGSAP